jgi:hypothetical protein
MCIGTRSPTPLFLVGLNLEVEMYKSASGATQASGEWREEGPYFIEKATSTDIQSYSSITPRHFSFTSYFPFALKDTLL